MSRNKTSKSPDKGNNNTIAIAIAIIGLVGTLITAYFGFRASTEPIAMIIGATKTAQVLPTNPTGLISLTPVITTPSSQTSAPAPMVTYPADCTGYERLNDWVQAAECYKQKVIANPNNFQALNDVARAYGNGGQFEKEAEIAQEMMFVADNIDNNIGESAEAILILGVAYYNLKDYASAVNTLSMGIDSRYSQTGAYFLISQWLARSYEANGEASKACEQFKITLAMAQQRNYNQRTLDEYQSAISRNCP